MQPVRLTALLSALALLLAVAWLWLGPDPGPPPAVESSPAGAPRSQPARPSEALTTDSRESAAPAPAPASRGKGPVELVGRVLDDRAGAAVAAAEVQVRAANGAELAETVTAGDGRFALRAPAPTQVLVRAAGLVPALVTVPTTGPDDRIDLGDLYLRHGCRARARVALASDRTPIADAPLWQVMPGEDPLHLGTTRADGTLELAFALAPTALEDDPMLVTVTRDGFGAGALLVPEGQDTATVEVLVRRGGDLAITVQDESGAPLTDATLALQPEALPWSAARLPREILDRLRTRADAEGHAQLTRVPVVTPGAVTLAGSGGWALWASGPGLRATCARGFQLVEAATTPVLVRVPRVQEITLVVAVRDPQGKPVPRVSVRAPSTGERLDDLRVRFAAVQVPPEGTVRVVAGAPDFADLVQHVPIPPGVREHSVDLVLDHARVVRGQLVDLAGAPVAGQSLQFLVAGGPRGWVSARSDAHGEFQFAVGSTQDWSLAVRARADRNVWLLPEPRTGRGGAELRVVLTPRPHTGTTLAVTITSGGAPLAAVPRQIELLPEAPAPEPAAAGRFALDAGPGQFTATGLWPGSWRVRFQVDETFQCERRVAIAAGQEQTQVAIEAGARGAIAGEVRFEGVPVELLPELVTVVVDPVCGRQVSDGRFPVRARVGRATVRPRRQGTFRLEDVPAGQPLRLELQLGEGSPWHARAEVTVPERGVARAVLVAQAGGFVRLRSEQTLPAGWVRFEPAQQGGFRPATPLVQLARRLDLALPFPAGSHRGQLAVRSGAAEAAPLLWAAPVEFTVGAGSTVEVRITGPGPR